MVDALAPRLIIGIGNPSRGDDALGPLCIERLEALCLPDTELLTDFQLQVEFTLDLQGREEVIFVDASASGAAPYAFDPVTARADQSYTSHAVSPAALLAACRQIGIALPPATHVLAIRGYQFELGEPLSGKAAEHLEQAIAFLTTRCTSHAAAEPAEA